jgi:hypothetical protein
MVEQISPAEPSHAYDVASNICHALVPDAFEPSSLDIRAPFHVASNVCDGRTVISMSCGARCATTRDSGP